MGDERGGEGEEGGEQQAAAFAVHAPGRRARRGSALAGPAAGDTIAWGSTGGGLMERLVSAYSVLPWLRRSDTPTARAATGPGPSSSYQREAADIEAAVP